MSAQLPTASANAESAAPWHRGEVTLQKSVGVDARMADVGRRIIRDHMPDQHRDFFAAIPFIIAGAVDVSGDPWVTLLSGQPGFMSSPDPKSLTIDASIDPRDPASSGLNSGDAIGLLGMQLETRRRNRMNGRIAVRTNDRLSVSVEHSFGNCPQYISVRAPEFVREPQSHAADEPIETATLSGRGREVVESADTFFVASYVDEPSRQVDASHRGGKPGFVRIGDDGVLTVPDFAGNLFFNTLGNFLVNPRAGLLFVDFETGDVVQMTGTAEVLLDSPEIAGFQGAERLWTFTPTRVVLRPAAFPLRATSEEASPNSLLTGDWENARVHAEAQAKRLEWRPFRVTKIIDESSVIRSFHLEPDDGGGLIRHDAGQHLPLRIEIPGQDKPVVRTYTLSTAPSDGAYRISVKRDGLVSSHLHDTLKVGDLIEARAPAGAFVLADERSKRPVVLLAAGVGVTPMLAMLKHLVFEAKRLRMPRPVWFFQSARSKAERAFDDEIAGLVSEVPETVTWTRVLSAPEPEAVDGEDYDRRGRIDADLLKEVLPFGDHDFYLCGPAGFTQSLYDQLRDLRVPDDRIHAEAFGPSTLVRRADLGAEAAPMLEPATEPVPVVFAGSAKEARWTPEAGTLLEVAEDRGLAPPFSCRSGTCGSCMTPIVEGAVTYESQPSFPVEDGHALICCAVPAKDGGDRLILDV